MMHRRTRNILLFLAATLPFFASLFYFVLLSGSPLAQPTYSATKLFTLIWPLVFYRWVVKEPFPPFPLFKNSAKAAVGGLFAGGTLNLILLGLMATPLGTVVEESVPAIRLKAESLGILNYYILFALFLSLAHSLIEEYYWRWFIFGELRRVFGDGFRAHTLAALAFALHHIVVAAQYFPLLYGIGFGLAVGFGGATWSMLYARHSSLLGAWISHAMVDICLLSLGYFLLFP